MWEVLTSRQFQKQLKKLDPQIARRILQDMDSLKQDPLQSFVDADPLARMLRIRYIKAAHDWRVYFRMEGKKVLVEFVFHRETAYEEVARYLRSLKL